MVTSGTAARIDALRRSHDDMAARIESLGVDELAKASGASEWTVAQVLSHLGSGAEIGLGTLRAGKADRSVFPSVWERWNAMSPSEQAAGFVLEDERLIRHLESVDAAELAESRLDLGFGPEPVDIGFWVRLRLNETGLHRWDVEVAFDPGSVVVDYAVPLILEGLATIAGYLARPGGRSGTVEFLTTDPDEVFALDLEGDHATLRAGPDESATTRVRLPAETFLRLVSGRMGPTHTPSTVVVEGALSLEDLRQIFPGF